MVEAAFTWEEESNCVVICWTESNATRMLPLRAGDVVCHHPGDVETTLSNGEVEQTPHSDAWVGVIHGLDFANQTILAPLVNDKTANPMVIPQSKVCVEQTIKANFVLQLIKNGYLTKDQVTETAHCIDAFPEAKRRV